jgi:hypothetical protein
MGTDARAPSNKTAKGMANISKALIQGDKKAIAELLTTFVGKDGKVPIPKQMIPPGILKLLPKGVQDGDPEDIASFVGGIMSSLSRNDTAKTGMLGKGGASWGSLSGLLGTGLFGNLPVIPGPLSGLQPSQSSANSGFSEPGTKPSSASRVLSHSPAWIRHVKRHNPGEAMMRFGGGKLSNLVPTVTNFSGRADMDSRLFGKAELEDPRMEQALEGSMPFGQMDGQIRLHLVGGPPMWELAKTVNTSVHPQWFSKCSRSHSTGLIGLETYVHSIATSGGTNDGGVPNTQAFRDFAPQTAAYSNEVSMEAFIALLTTINHRLGSRIPTGKKTFGAQITIDCPRSRPNGTQTLSFTSLLASTQTT